MGLLACGGTAVASTGQWLSLGYSLSAALNGTCVWNVTTDVGQQVAIVITALNLCQQGPDTINIYDGIIEQ